MSAPIFAGDVRFLQRFLSTGGFDPGPIDGAWGPRTDAALQRFEAATSAIADELGRLHARSEQAIATLLPAAQRAARRLLTALVGAGMDARAISGTRTYAEQDALFAQGRTAPGQVVTNARGGQSNHNFGIAWDIGIWVEGFYGGVTRPRRATLERQADELYGAAGAISLDQGLDWGGGWSSFPDRPHHGLKHRHSTRALRALFEAGQPLP